MTRGTNQLATEKESEIPKKAGGTVAQNKEEEEPENFSPILRREIEAAISGLKKERAPGPDKITNDLIKIFAVELIPVLADLFNLMIEK